MEKMVNVYFFGKKYSVPAELTIIDVYKRQLYKRYTEYKDQILTTEVYHS